MIKIYITDLEAYNNGYLVGEWIELPSSNLEADISRILEAGAKACNDLNRHEEYFIADYECDYIKIGEYDDIFDLQVNLSIVNDVLAISKPLNFVSFTLVSFKLFSFKFSSLMTLVYFQVLLQILVSHLSHFLR